MLRLEVGRLEWSSWVLRSRREVIDRDVSGYLQGSSNKSWRGKRHLKMGPIGYPETSVTTNLRYVTSQNSEDLNYTEADAWNDPKTGAIYLSFSVSSLMLKYEDTFDLQKAIPNFLSCAATWPANKGMGMDVKLVAPARKPSASEVRVRTCGNDR